MIVRTILPTKIPWHDPGYIV